MRVPPAKPRIDVEAVLSAIERGSTIPQFAAEHGFSASAIRRALHRAGVHVARASQLVRNQAERRLKSTWNSIRSRCTDPASKQFALYGGRGITLCAQWKDFAGFREWSIWSGYEPGRLIMLRVRSRGYRPSNCYWASRSEVIREGMKHASPSGPRPEANRRHIDWNAVERLYVRKELSVSETAAKLGCSYHGILNGLIRHGWYRGRPTPAHARKHGTALKKVWQNMRERCTSRRHPDFKCVGGRGIRIDRAWREFADFHDWAMKSGYTRGLVLTRLESTGNFGPANCAWMTFADSLGHRTLPRISRKPRWTITAFGETKGPVAWSRDPRCTVTAGALISRLKNGLPPEEAIVARNRSAGAVVEGRSVRAFGMNQSLSAWARDRRARVGASSIRARLEQGMKPELAISMPPFASAGRRAMAGRFRK